MPLFQLPSGVGSVSIDGATLAVSFHGTVDVPNPGPMLRALADLGAEPTTEADSLIACIEAAAPGTRVDRRRSLPQLRELAEAALRDAANA